MSPILLALLRAGAVAGGVLATVPYLVFAERKICAYIQMRIGPNRVGPWGLLQPLADGLKLLMKEEIIPEGAHRFAYLAAPVLVMIPAISVLAIVPFGEPLRIGGETLALQVADLPIGVLFFLAVSSLSVYGLALGGWGSNNKYSLLGGLRACAQLVSYEVSMGLCVLGLVLAAGSVSCSDMVALQAQPLWGPIPAWSLFTQPLGFAVFLVCAFAENNRLPFDLPEAEPELVAGYHTEYTGLRFGTFFLGEYASMIAMSALLATFYLGGYHIPFADLGGLSPVARSLLTAACFGAKVFAILFLFIWVRWTLPRFKYQGLMAFSWKLLLPLAMANLAFASLVAVPLGR